MNSLDYYLEQIRQWPPLAPEEETELVIKAKNGDKQAEDKIIKSNLRFVFQIAKNYQNKGLDLEDLIAEGNIGLLKALERFDLSLGYKFISYAVWWIRQSILTAIYKYASPIRMPINKITETNKILKVKNSLEQELSREPSHEEILEAINETDLIFTPYFNLISLDDAAILDEGDGTLHEIIPAEENKRSEFEVDFLQLLVHFSDREKKILTMYYGIGEIRPHTLREIGADLGLTRERVRQIKTAALKKLKTLPGAEDLIKYYDLE